MLSTAELPMQATVGRCTLTATPDPGYRPQSATRSEPLGSFTVELRTRWQRDRFRFDLNRDKACALLQDFRLTEAMDFEAAAAWVRAWWKSHQPYRPTHLVVYAERRQSGRWKPGSQRHTRGHAAGRQDQTT